MARLNVDIESRDAIQGAKEVSSALDMISKDAKEMARDVSNSGGKVDDAFDKIGSDAAKSKKSIMDFKSAFVFTAAIGAVAGLSAAVLGMADDIDTMGKSASRLGVSFEFFQEMKHVADQNGVAFESMQDAIKDLNLRVGEAASGSKQLTEQFKDLGVNIHDSNGEVRATEDIFADVLGALKDVGSEAERFTIAQKLMGESGTKLNNIIKAGPGAMKALQDQAHELGIVLGDEAADNAAKLNDQVDILTKRVSGSFQSAFAAAAPTMLNFLDSVERTFIGVGKLSDAFMRAIGLAKEQAATAPGGAVVASSTEDILNNIKQIESQLGQFNASATASQAQTLYNLYQELESRNVVLAKQEEEKQAIEEKNALALRWEQALTKQSEARFEAQLAGIRQVREEELMSQIGIGADPDTVVDPFVGPSMTTTQEMLREKMGLVAGIYREQSEIRQQMLDDEINSVNMALDERVISEEYAQTLITKIHERENSRRNKLSLSAAQTIAGSLTTVASVFKDESEDAFRWYQGIAATETAIATAQSVMTTYAKYGNTPWGIGAAIAVGMAGAAKVHQILSMSPGSAGGAAAGISAGSDVPRSQLEPADINQQQQSSQVVQVFVSGNVMTQDFVENDVIPAIQVAVGERDFEVIPSDSRQAQIIRTGAI